jgi:DNA-binding NtrC family response regulator
MVIEMRAEDIRLEELISFSDGMVSLHGRRLVFHDVHAIAQLRKDLVETIGVDQTRRILSRFGYYWGEDDASAVNRIFEWDDVTEWLKAGPRLHELQGVARVEVKSLELSAEGKYRMEVIWHDSVEADEHLIELGASPEASCWILQGYASGYASYCLERPVYFTEVTCRARGDEVCRAVGMDSDSWGDEAGALMRNYRVDDIQGKIDELTAALRKRTLELIRQQKRLRHADFPGALGFPQIRSKSFRQVLDLGRRLARFDSSVLITGESGVGKEVVARFIHENSSRKRGPFVAVDCGALPETLLESELFGHKAGSFTGAIQDRAGLFEQGEGGTIFLDEIGDVSASLQVKLLRVIQEKQIRRVGENRVRDIDVRIIAATNRLLEREVKEGRFREDLFYRLRVVEIHIPPLRERPEDILPLARFFTERLVERLKLERLTLDAASLPVLERHTWPGNVRELENAIERAAVMCDDGRIRVEHLPPAMLGVERHDAAGSSGTTRPLAEMEREYVLAVLKSVDGNKARAAKVLGIGTTTLWRKLKEWGETG